MTDSPFAIRQSFVKQWVKCPRSAFYQYIQKVPHATPLVVAAGLAGHEGIAFAITQQIETGEPCNPEQAGEIAADAADAIVDDIDWYEEGHKGTTSDLRDRARAFAEVYVAHVAPTLNPLAAEQHFEIDVDGVFFTGTMDVSTDTGPRDTKTTKRTPSGWGDPSHRFQLGTYGLAWLADGYRDPPDAAIDYLVLSETKTDGRSVRHLPVYIDRAAMAEEMEVAREMIVRADAAVRAGDFARNVTACAEWMRPCPFMSRCMPTRATAVERGKAVSEGWAKAKDEAKAAASAETKAAKTEQREAQKAAKAAEKAADRAAKADARAGKTPISKPAEAE